VPLALHHRVQRAAKMTIGALVGVKDSNDQAKSVPSTGGGAQTEGKGKQYVVAYVDDWQHNVGEAAHSASSRSLGVFQHVAREEQTLARMKTAVAMLTAQVKSLEAENLRYKAEVPRSAALCQIFFLLPSHPSLDLPLPPSLDLPPTMPHRPRWRAARSTSALATQPSQQPSSVLRRARWPWWLRPALLNAHLLTDWAGTSQDLHSAAAEKGPRGAKAPEAGGGQSQSGFEHCLTPTLHLPQ
jgi:hypothetical protein